jgi:hypothetical protein
LQLLLEFSQDAAASARWREVEQRWAPPPDGTDEEQVSRFVARLAAQGLWLHQVAAEQPLTPEQVRAVAAYLARGLAAGPEVTEG